METRLSGLAIRQYSNNHAQLQRLAKISKFYMWQMETLSYQKGLIRLIRAYVVVIVHLGFLTARPTSCFAFQR